MLQLFDTVYRVMGWQGMNGRKIPGKVLKIEGEGKTRRVNVVWIDGTVSKRISISHLCMRKKSGYFIQIPQE